MGLRTATTPANRNRRSRGHGSQRNGGDERESRVSVVRRTLACVLVTLLLAASASAASYSEHGKGKYNSKEAGHPLRIAAYILHPVGVILDRLILRPAYWLGRKEPIKTLVGNTD